MALHVAYRGNGILLELRALKTAQTKVVITDASPSAVLKDLDGNSLGSVTLTHDASGTYFGTISPGVIIGDDVEQGNLTVTIGGAYLGKWETLIDFRDRKI
ncbi:MAG: hypothetical protein ACTSVR_08360 [Candidatus Thorarchaeota archaeon]